MFNQLVTPAAYMEMRYNTQLAMEEAVRRYDRIEKEFSSIFDRAYGPVEAIHCEDAEIILVTTGTVTGTCRQVLAELRARGEKVGLFKLKMFRPFPADIIRRHLGSARKIAVVDRNFSFGAGGIFAQEIRAALCKLALRPQVFGFIAGLGGRDITPQTLTEIYHKTKKSSAPTEESIWIGLNQEVVGSWSN
jgi:pyruvate/2-oxoacid:ferredoxin oxidoreductase alpha subunit